MNKKRKKYLNSMYNYISGSKSYEIGVNLNSYEEVYNHFDYSQFKKRDLDKDFLDYIYMCSKDIPTSYNVVVTLYVNKNIQNDDKDTLLKNSIKNNLIWRLASIRIKMKRMAKECALMSVFWIGTMALTFLNVFKNAPGIIYNGLVIASWVFLWNVIEIIIFDIKEYFKEYRYTKRLINSRIKFKEY